jgi:hypothetical protein
MNGRRGKTRLQQINDEVVAFVRWIEGCRAAKTA